jgi:CRP-like cAMP-binding protein
MTAVQQRPAVAGRAALQDDDADRAVLRQAEIFRGAAPRAVEALVAAMEPVSLGRGSVVFRQGEPGRFLYVVLSGTVKLTACEPDGVERLVAVLGPREQFGELAVLDPGPRTATATAVDDARLARVAKPQLDAWMQQHPEVTLQMLRVLSRRLRRTRADLADMIFLDVPGRVAKLLLDLAARYGVRTAEGLEVAHGLRQVELAQLAGSSRETVNKSLSDFANRGWVRAGHGVITILDPERLRRRAR